MVDPGDWLPLVGVGLLGLTTVVSLVGAYALGLSRRRDRLPKPPVDTAEQERIERMERMLETMAVEIERLGESQRFLVKVLGDRQLPAGAEPPKPQPRVITPH
jgi:hypothetical protein